MSTQSPTPGNDATSSSSSSRRNKSWSGKSKRSKVKDENNGVPFKGNTIGFGAVLTFKGETTEGKGNTYKEAILATEVRVASNFSATSKAKKSLFEDTPKNPSLSPPTELIGYDADNGFKCKTHFKLFKRYLNDNETLTNNIHSLFSIIRGQSSPGIQSRLKGKVEYLIKKENGDCAYLLQEIRQAMLITTPDGTKSRACSMQNLNFQSSIKGDYLQFNTSINSSNTYLSTFFVTLVVP